MNSKNRSIWAFVITSVALFMASLDIPASFYKLTAWGEHAGQDSSGIAP